MWNFFSHIIIEYIASQVAFYCAMKCFLRIDAVDMDYLVLYAFCFPDQFIPNIVHDVACNNLNDPNSLILSMLDSSMA